MRDSTSRTASPRPLRPDGRYRSVRGRTRRRNAASRREPVDGTAILASAYNFPSSAPITNAASAPTITDADGRLEIFYREASSGHVITYYTTTTGTWAGPVILYGDSGVGPVAAMTSDRAARSSSSNATSGTESTATWRFAPNDVFQLQWTILGGYLDEYPAAATDANGETALVVKGGDGRLYLSQHANPQAPGRSGRTPSSAEFREARRR